MHKIIKCFVITALIFCLAACGKAVERELPESVETVVTPDAPAENIKPATQNIIKGNPFVTDIFTADPSAHVWDDGKLYVYASHDMFPSRGCDLMDKYHVFSTEDMISFTDEGEILSSDDVTWGRPEGGFMWAPDAAYVSGTYYFYFPHPTGSGDLWNSTWRIGVATSNKPASDFVCADDGYVKMKDGSPYVTCIDPCIFADDDGTYYLYTGGGSKCFVARMDTDMITLAEDPVEIDSSLNDFHEGMWVFKKDGIYYAMYADNSEGQNRLRYSVSSSPYGPFSYGGIVLEGTGCDTSHGSITEYNGKWYLFYHCCDISGNGTLRSVCVDELTFNDDFTINTVEQTRRDLSDINAGYEEYTNETDYSFLLAEVGGGAGKGATSAENLHMNGAYIEWNNVDGGKGGKALLAVRYGTPEGGTSLVHASGDASGDGYFLRFYKTSSWGDYSGTSKILIDLNPGTDNRVRLTCGMGGVNITGITISMTDN